MGRPPIGKTAMSGAERMQRLRAKQKAEQPPKPDSSGESEALRREVGRLKVELNSTLSLKAESAGLRKLNVALMREVAILEQRLQAPPKPESAVVAELERQLKAARTRITNLRVEAKMTWEQAQANPASIAKAEHRKLQKVFHPDGEANVSAARKRQLTEAAQIFNGIKFRVRD